MHKILILSLLFAMFAVPANAQTEKELEERFHAYAIQSFGWKCNEIQDVDGGLIERKQLESSEDYGVIKLKCENNLVYYVRMIRKLSREVGTTTEFVFCHKGTCKKFE